MRRLRCGSKRKRRAQVGELGKRIRSGLARNFQNAKTNLQLPSPRLPRVSSTIPTSILLLSTTGIAFVTVDKYPSVLQTDELVPGRTSIETVPNTLKSKLLPTPRKPKLTALLTPESAFLGFGLKCADSRAMQIDDEER
ncbi:hypothetical protein BJX65DRAFT_105288 [Aspergillus insuetus]